MNQFEAYESGRLDVGEGHELYWEQWGNPEADPTLFFHGGPGSGFSDGHKLLFSSAVHNVVFLDQRGCGKSTPFAETSNNTTQDLISDTERLRENLGIEKWNVVGGSWGSTLGLVYAIEHPECVNKMVLWGIFLGTRFEEDWISAGANKETYPEAWERYIALVPEEYRTDGDSITRYFNDQMHSDDTERAKKYAYEWTRWEVRQISLAYATEEQTDASMDEADDTNLSIAKLETHYFMNDCFLEDDYIIKNIDKISHIPTSVVHGRFDDVCPPSSAYKLAQAAGKNMVLQWVASGHIRHDPEMRAALQATLLAKLT